MPKIIYRTIWGQAIPGNAVSIGLAAEENESPPPPPPPSARAAYPTLP